MQRGVILPTAMFMAMVVLAAVTVNLLDSRQSLRLSVFSDGNLRAASAAEGGIEWGLAELSRPGSNFFTTNVGAGSAATAQLGEESVEVWIEQVDPNVYELVARSTQGGLSQQRRARLRQAGETDGMVYSRSLVGTESYQSRGAGTLTRGLFTLFGKRPNDAQWTAVPPPPDRYFIGDPSAPTEKDGPESYAKGLNSLIGDTQGNLFAIDRREDGNTDPATSVAEDSLWKWDGSDWQSIVPPPQGAYASWNDTTLTSPSQPELSHKLKQLAVGGDSLFLICETGGGGGSSDPVDAIWRRRGSSWSVLPNPSAGLGDNKDAKELCADKKGNLYCVVGKETRVQIRESLRQADDSMGAFTTIAPPTVPWGDGRDEGTELVSADDGTLFCLRKQENHGSTPDYDKIFQRVNGSWTEIDLPEVDSAGQITPHGTGSPEVQIDEMAIDAKGRLYFTSRRTGVPDVIYGYDPVARSWSILPKQPDIRFNSTAKQDFQGGNSVATEARDLAGGGVESQTGSGAYRRLMVYTP